MTTHPIPWFRRHPALLYIVVGVVFLASAAALNCSERDVSTRRGARTRAVRQASPEPQGIQLTFKKPIFGCPSPDLFHEARRAIRSRETYDLIPDECELFLEGDRVALIGVYGASTDYPLAHVRDRRGRAWWTLVDFLDWSN